MKRKLIHCLFKINRDLIRRETIDGVEHIVVTSYTMPNNIVMNNGLYPAEEIDKSFKTLERTLAPVEHPQNADGKYISASDPVAIHNYHAGAFNMNVTKDGDRIRIDKYISVPEAMKTERGKRLLDRVNELETNENPRPIHTSTGVFVVPEILDEPMTNSDGQKYSWIAREMTFDHDAILLDSVGAAQPHQGVGMGVNSDEGDLDVETFIINKDIQNVDGQSTSEKHRAVQKALEGVGLGGVWIDELFNEEVIFSSGEELFTVPYLVDDNDIVTIVGIPLPVERNVSFVPKTNSQKGEAMKDFILNALKAAGIEVNDEMTDEQLFEMYNKTLEANQQSGDDSGNDDDNASIAEAVTNAMKPFSEQLEGLQMQLNAQSENDKTNAISVIVNSGKYPGLDEESAKLLGVEKLKEMAANCGVSYGFSPMVTNIGKTDEAFDAPSDMPK